MGIDLSTLVPTVSHLSTLLLLAVLVAFGVGAKALIRVDKSLTPSGVDKSETPTCETGRNPKTATAGTGRREPCSASTRVSMQAHWLSATLAPMTRANLTKLQAPSGNLQILTLSYYSPVQVPTS